MARWVEEQLECPSTHKLYVLEWFQIWYGCMDVLAKSPSLLQLSTKSLLTLMRKMRKEVCAQNWQGKKIYVHCLLPFSDQDCDVVYKSQPLLVCRAEKTDAVESGMYLI